MTPDIAQVTSRDTAAALTSRPRVSACRLKARLYIKCPIGGMPWIPDGRHDEENAAGHG